MERFSKRVFHAGGPVSMSLSLLPPEPIDKRLR